MIMNAPFDIKGVWKFWKKKTTTTSTTMMSKNKAKQKQKQLSPTSTSNPPLKSNGLLDLRGYCTPNLKLTCFVLYLKIINTFFKK